MYAVKQPSTCRTRIMNEFINNIKKNEKIHHSHSAS